MPQVFLSYSKKDSAAAARIVSGLKAEGIDVWWDDGIATGAKWRNEIERQLHAAEVIVTLWSANAATSDWVLEEAEFGRQKGVLHPARLDASPIPLGFGGTQAADLSGWSGSVADEAWHRFSAGLAARLRGDLPPAFEGARRRKRFRRLAAALALCALGAGAAALLFWPTAFASFAPASERAAYSEAMHSGCAALRIFVEDAPFSILALDARRKLANSSTIEEARWTAFEQSLPVAAESGLDAAGSQETACSEARARVSQQGQELCALHQTVGARTRAVDARVAADAACNCRITAGAAGLWRCGVDTTVSCVGEREQMVIVEKC